MEETTQGQDRPLPWDAPDWLEMASRWIRAELERQGRTPAGEIELVHMRPWSAFARVPTTEGMVYFKATAPSLRFEAAFVQALSRWRPDCVPPLLAVDLGRGWLLTPDAGVTLRDLTRTPAQLEHWRRLLPLYAELQIELAPRVPELLALGVPDRRLSILPRLYDALLDDTENLRLDRPNGLTTDEHRRLLALRPRVAALCDRLTEYGLPETMTHEEVHEANVLARGNRYLFIDWSDSSVAHPFFTMLVTMRSVAHWLGLPENGPDLTRLRDLYLDPWTRFAPRERLLAAFPLACRLAMINRALSYYGVFGPLPERYKAESDGISGWLRDFLESDER